MNSRDNLKVLLIDPCFRNKNIVNSTTPLSVGLVGSYLQHNVPEVTVKILKDSPTIIEYIENEKPDVMGVCSYFWNTNLGNKLSRVARDVNPELLLVFGGPEVNTEPVDRKCFIKKFSHADILVEHEGEIAFTNLIKTYLDLGRDKTKLRDHIEELGNCFYVDQEGGIIKGPKLPRIKSLNDVPSPYMMGLFDEFLANKSFVPMIQTNRGCPYSCTFCQEGMGYYSKINYHSLDYVIDELNYIVERAHPESGLYIVDSNWGMYAQDVEIAKHLRHLKDKYTWPHYVYGSTGKSQLPRIKKVVEILDGALLIANAVQSLDDNVLQIVKRKNAVDLKDFMKNLETMSEPEIILPLPGETKDSFLKGLNEIIDTNSRTRLSVYHCLLLSNTQMNSKETIEDYGFKIMYRQHQNLTGYCAGELICETERNIVSTSTMSIEEAVSCRIYVTLMDTLFREEPVKEIFSYLDSKEIRRSKFTMRLYNNLNEGPPAIRKCIEEYTNTYYEEIYENEEDVVEYMNKYGEEYSLGIKGGDLLKYSMMFWIEAYSEMLDWIFEHLEFLLKDDEEAPQELQALRMYFDSLYYDRSEQTIDKSSELVVQLNYDIAKWFETKPLQPLESFKKEVTYTFRQTETSGIDKASVWQSFGFYKSEDFDPLPAGLGRLFVSRLRRTFEVDAHKGRNSLEAV